MGGLGDYRKVLILLKKHSNSWQGHPRGRGNDIKAVSRERCLMLCRDDYREVARIHKEAISAGFLSTLGVDFLALLYESIDQSKDCALLVIRSEGKIVGFVSAARGLGTVYRHMLRSWGRLGMALLPAVFSLRKLYRIIETVMFSRSQRDERIDLPHDELLSIAVAGEFRGMGFADQLFEALKQHFRTNEVRRFRIVVGDALAPAHRFYRKMGAYPVGRAEVHKGSGSVIYVCDVK